MKGHAVEPKDVKYKDGDKEGLILPCHTTDKILAFGTNGRFYTLSANEMPAGRGYGEPLSLMIDLPDGARINNFHLYNDDEKLLVASSLGHGFIVKHSDVLAQTKGGKKVLNVKAPATALIAKPVAPEHDHIAVIGKNRKLLVFPLVDLPEMGRGKGITLQKYKDGGLSDAKTFKMETGLAHKYGSGERIVEDITPWVGKRASAGRMPPNGFPRNNKFD